MKWEKYAIVILTVVILGMSYVMFSGNMLASTGTVEHVGYVGMVCPVVTRVDGTVEDLGCHKNYLTNNGTNITTRQLFNIPSGISLEDKVVRMALGNTTGNFEVSIHPGEITECGLSAVEPIVWDDVASSKGNSGNVTNATKWTSTCSGIVVNTTGLLTNSSESKTYFAGNNFSDSVTLQSSDQLTVTWYVWVA